MFQFLLFIFFLNLFINLTRICATERSRAGRDQRVSVHGRYGDPANGAAQAEDGVRNEPKRPENRTEHTRLSGDHIASTRKTTNR